MKITPFCAWGDGPDVGINIERTKEEVAAYPSLTFIALDFTADEAIKLGRELIELGKTAKELDREYEEYAKREH